MACDLAHEFAFDRHLDNTGATAIPQHDELCAWPAKSDTCPHVGGQWHVVIVAQLKELSICLLLAHARFFPRDSV
jgi:hypothetical protein